MDLSSIYEFAGGDDAFLALAAATTERCIADPELNHAFGQGLSPRHNENLAAYWAEVFGGPPRYTTMLGGQSAMLDIHAGYGAPDDWATVSRRASSRRWTTRNSRPMKSSAA